MTVSPTPRDGDPFVVSKLSEFLIEYIRLCKHYGCMVVSDGEQVEAIYDPLDIHYSDCARVQEVTFARLEKAALMKE